MKIALAAVAVILVLLTVILSKLIVSALDIKMIIHSGINEMHKQYSKIKLRNEVRKYTRVVSIKMSLPEKAELFLIDKSNIRRYIPFFNVYVLLFFSMSVFIAAFQPVYKALYFVPSTVVICLVLSLIPTIILDMMGRYNAAKIRGQIPVFISVLNRWCKIKADIFYAFEKSVEYLEEPLRTYITDTVFQVQRGVDQMDALDMLSMKADNEQFKDLLINIKQNVKHRGDLVRLLSNMEAQAYKMKKEYTRRKISTFRDRVLLYGVMFAVLFIGYTFLKINVEVEQFYLSTLHGKLLVAVFSILYAVGFYVTAGIARFDH